jgi:hypothetical protein
MGKEEEEENLLENVEASPKQTTRKKRLLPFVLIISVLLNILFMFFGLFNFAQGQNSTAKGSYENGFATDLGM